MNREGVPINFHIVSSIWSIIKSEVDCVTTSTRIVLGNACNTNFWLDPWCGSPLVNQIQDPDGLNTNILVSNFLHNGSWNFLIHMIHKIRNLSLISDQITIPIDNMVDNKIWLTLVLEI